MGNETAYWEALIAVTPLLALTIIVELRPLPWAELNPMVKRAAIFFLTTALVLLSTTLVVSLLVLSQWNHPGFQNKELGVWFTLGAVIFAMVGVLLFPVSMTLVLALGPSALSRVRLLQATHRATEETFQRHMADLRRLQHEVKLELMESVLASKGELFAPMATGAKLELANSTTATLRSQSQDLQRRIRAAEHAHVKWDKARRKTLKKIHRWYPVRTARDFATLGNSGGKRRHKKMPEELLALDKRTAV